MNTKSRMRFAKTLVSLLLMVILLFAAACNPEQGTGGGGGTGEEDKTGVKALRITKIRAPNMRRAKYFHLPA